MPRLPRTMPFFRPLFGSILLVAGLLVINACGTSSTTTQQSQSPSRTLRLTAIDSTSGAPLDSARAVNRTFGDSLHTDSAGQFVLQDVDPALYVFDVGGYGYHTQRHVSILVEPDDTARSVSTPLLPQRLTINCQGERPYFWETVVRQYQEDSTRIRFKLIDVFAQDGEVRVQPVVVNDLSSPIFVPDNYGALGHYEISLYDGNSNRLPFTYKDAPRDDGHRIYSKGNILPVVPNDLKRLEPTTLVVGDSIESGTTIFARMRYTFSTDDTLRATSATTFPDLNLDSLQTPIFDTLRTDGAVEVADSLVLQRDTTIMSVVGIDTTVTRNGYTIYSTLQDNNAAPNAKAARNLLYVPDSVVARTRRDSLRAAAEADTTVPGIDTAAVAAPDSSPLQIVERTNTEGLRALINDERLVQSLANGLPTPNMSADSLLSFSETFRRAYLQTPTLSEVRVRRGLNTIPDSARTDSVILSAPASDSLFRILDPDLASASDTSLSLAQTNPFVRPDASALLAPEADSITLDSLRLTVGPDADSVTTTTVPKNTLSNPPTYSYWYLPPSLSRSGGRLLVVDPSFFRLRAKPQVDTTAGITITDLLPNRVGRREQDGLQRYPQQVVRAPAGTYRSTYLKAWKALQEDRLEQHYCEVLPFPLRSDWRSASMQ